VPPDADHLNVADGDDVERLYGNGTMPVELFAAVEEAAAEALPVAEADVEAVAESVAEAVAGDDEWDGLRQMLAGDDDLAPVTDDVEPELDADIEPDAEAIADAEAFLAAVAALGGQDGIAVESSAPDPVTALTAQVDQLASALADERAERERLAAQLDRLATELDVVLGEALAEERQRREQLEETLRLVQANLLPERRADSDRRSGGERRRERPLRAARVAAPEPAAVDDLVDEDDRLVDDDADAPITDAAPGPEGTTSSSAWPSRLQEVGGSVSAWSAEDIERLRED
jgi:hypothetical protein